MRILITGISGFVGSHLAEYELSIGMEITGAIRHRSNLKNIERIKNDIGLVECDVTDSFSVVKMIREVKPDIIHHLAAQSFVPTSWRSPQETLNVNIMGTVNILEASRLYCPEAIIHLTGSSEEYGLVLKDEIPIKETNPLRPMSPYGVSKVAEDLLGQQYHHSYDMKIIISRAFNHEGARRGKEFVTSQFARQTIMFERKQTNEILVGNTEAIRDFSDVRDIVRAYWLLTQKGLAGEVYNICSGKGTRMTELLMMFLELRTRRDQVTIRGDASRIRPSDVPVLIGDNSKIKKLGWKPEIPLEETVAWMMDYWREEIAG